nr:immunoglobulin light chain junction region [Macaca mulatta]
DYYCSAWDNSLTNLFF